MNIKSNGLSYYEKDAILCTLCDAVADLKSFVTWADVHDHRGGWTISTEVEHNLPHPFRLMFDVKNVPNPCAIEDRVRMDIDRLSSFFTGYMRLAEEFEYFGDYDEHLMWDTIRDTFEFLIEKVLPDFDPQGLTGKDYIKGRESANTVIPYAKGCYAALQARFYEFLARRWSDEKIKENYKPADYALFKSAYMTENICSTMDR